MKKISALLEKRWFASTFAVCAGVALYMLLAHLGPMAAWLGSLWKMLSPVVIGLILAYLIEPIARFWERRLQRLIPREQRRRVLAVLLAILLVLLILALFVLMVVPSLIRSISGVVENADTYYEKAKSLIESFNGSNLGIDLNLEEIEEMAISALQGLLKNVTDNFSTILSKVGHVGSSAFNIVIGLIIAVYFLMGKKSLSADVDRLRRAALTGRRYESNTRFWRRCHEIFIQYIGCNLLDALIVGAANALFMLIFGMPYVALISVIVGTTNLLPTFGPIIGLILSALLLVLTKPVYALWFILFTLVLQAADGYVIKPRLFSNSLGIPAVWTLIAIILGGKLAGVTGILLAIPVAAVISMLYKERFLPWLQARRDEREHIARPAEKPVEDGIKEQADT